MAEVRVNGETWGGLKDDKKQRIVNILKDTGLIGPDDIVVGSLSPAPHSFKGANAKCVLGCNAAEQAAITACIALGPPDAQICIEVVHAAADECRNRC